MNLKIYTNTADLRIRRLILSSHSDSNKSPLRKIQENAIMNSRKAWGKTHLDKINNRRPLSEDDIVRLLELSTKPLEVKIPISTGKAIIDEYPFDYIQD